jgi:chromosome segregation ATPase
MSIENVNINAYGGMATQLLKRSQRIDAFQERHPDKAVKFETALETIKENYTTIIQIKYDTDVQDLVNGLSKEEIEQINAQIEAINQQINGFNEQLDDINQQITSDPENEALTSQIPVLEGEIALLESQLTLLQEDLQVAQNLFNQHLSLFDKLTETEKQLLMQLYPDSEYPV